MLEHLLFAVHRNTVSGRPAALLGDNHSLPIACSHHSWEDNPDGIPSAYAGFYALWESCTDVETFFEHLSLSSIEGGPDDKNPEGLYVYTVEYDEEALDDDNDEAWEHLTSGKLRRPTIEELNPFVHGQAPWGGKVF